VDPSGWVADFHLYRKQWSGWKIIRGFPLRKIYRVVLYPLIADQTVIQWGMGLKVGDTLLYLDSSGDTLSWNWLEDLLRRFPGYVIISDSLFPEAFSIYWRFICFSYWNTSRSDSLAEEDLSRAMRDQDGQMSLTANRLLNFIQWKYLSVYFSDAWYTEPCDRHSRTGLLIAEALWKEKVKWDCFRP